MNEILELPTPCFIFDEADFLRGIEGFREALQRKFKECAIGYSVKTNSLPYVLKLAHRYGCKAEVVSHDEYRLARLCGYEPNDMIYNGPMKSKETFIEAITGGATVNIETKRELQWLAELPEGSVYNVGLRLNINISRVSPEDAEGEDDNSRFGFSDETGEFADAVELIRSYRNVRLAGIHTHRTTHSRLPRYYLHAVDYAARVIKKYGLNVDYLDAGGGYYGIFPGKPTFDEYAESFYQSLKAYGLEDLKIIVEPGSAMTASTFKFLSEVIDVKQVDSKTRFATTDGSRNDIDPLFHKTDYMKEIIYAGGSENRETVPLQVVTGCTCLEYDRLFSLPDAPELRPGDRILYDKLDAYTMTLTPQFIRLWPRVYALDKDGRISLARRESRAEDIIEGDRDGADLRSRDR